MIESPPLSGGVHETRIVLSPRRPTGAAAAEGARSGCSGADEELHSPSPLAFTARTRKVYSVPFWRPGQVNEVPAPTRWTADVPPPIWRSKLVIALPSLAGGFHDTIRALSVNWTVGAAGRPGSTSGVTAGDGPLQSPQPALLWARTLNCTGSPLVSPVDV